MACSYEMLVLAVLVVALTSPDRRSGCSNPDVARRLLDPDVARRLLERLSLKPHRG